MGRGGGFALEVWNALVAMMGLMEVLKRGKGRKSMREVGCNNYKVN